MKAPADLSTGERLLSLDFLRGLIMMTLMIGETGFFMRWYTATPNAVTLFLHTQFEHSVWHGLRFWDVILPAFMLLAGTSMALSFHHQQQAGYSWKQSFFKVLKRSFWLLFWGVLIYSVRNGQLNFQLSNVLTQLSFTTLIAFMVIRQPVWQQLTASFLCLLIPELLSRLIQIPGFDQPFVQNHNFGSFINASLYIQLDDAHKTTFINFIGSGAHTIWGLMAGQLFLSNKNSTFQFTALIGFGVLFLMLGIGMDWAGITPLMKWISTSSFVLATGGISLIVLALCYEWVDVRRHRQHLKFFTIVGMNSIFIYLFFIFIGDRWLNGFMEVLCGGLLNLAGVPLEIGVTISCLVVFALEWYLCYFLYTKKLFFKL
jgi:predicted acyltransferase